MSDIKTTFETWMVKQFGNAIKRLLEDFHEEDGYADQNINGMWIGFNAGVELADNIK